MGSQLTFGSFSLYLDRGKVERETKHGGHKREHSIGAGHDGISFLFFFFNFQRAGFSHVNNTDF